MNTLFRHLPTFLLPGILILSMSSAVHAETRKLVTESGDNAQSRQHAVMEKEQWNDTRSLRHKINRRAEIKSMLRLTCVTGVCGALILMPARNPIHHAARTVGPGVWLHPEGA